jgi:hypothetical protein
VYKADEALRQLNEGDVFGERCLLEVCKRHALATSDAAAAYFDCSPPPPPPGLWMA